MSKNRDDLDRFLDYGLNFTSRTIFLNDDEDEEELNHCVAEQFIKNMLLLESAGQDEITVIINTQGGEVESGMAIYDAIDTSTCYVNGRVFRAESMGAVLLQACDKRIMMPHSKLMLHAGSIEVSDIHSHTTYKQIEENKRLDRVCETILLRRIKEKRPKFTRKQLKELLAHDTFLNSKQAINLGLADLIYER